MRLHFALIIAAATLCGFATACQAPPPRPPLPPSESDLDLLRSTTLCEKRDHFIQRHTATEIQRRSWGAGEELRIAGNQSLSKGDESYFFDEDGTLVGALFAFPEGLDWSLQDPAVYAFATQTSP